MATQEEKLAALNAALDAEGLSDPAEAKRFLLLSDALKKAEPPPAPSEPEAEGGAVILVGAQPKTDAHKQRYAALIADAKELMRDIDEAEAQA